MYFSWHCCVFLSISLLNFLLLKLAYCSKNWPFSNCFVSFNITGWTTVDKEFLVLSYRDVDTMGSFCSPYQNSVDFFSLCSCFFFHASSLIHWQFNWSVWQKFGLTTDSYKCYRLKQSIFSTALGELRLKAIKEYRYFLTWGYVWTHGAEKAHTNLVRRRD